MSTKAFILCAGDASRFPGGVIKQLLPVDDGVSILARLVWQLRHWGIDTYVVTHLRKEFEFEKTGVLCTGIIEPADRRFTCSTALSTAAHWIEERNLVMLGDVYWTHEALGEFLSQPLPVPTYATDGTDIFGLAFAGSASCWNVSAAFKRVLKEVGPTYGGRLHASRKYLKDSAYLLIKDRTQDFDTREEYDRFLKGISKRRAIVPPRRRGIAKG